jgi:hypothetical protein
MEENQPSQKIVKAELEKAIQNMLSELNKMTQYQMEINLNHYDYQNLLYLFLSVLRAS